MDLTQLKVLKAEIKKQMYLKGWTRATLSKEAGVSLGSIDAFLYGTRVSDSVAEKVFKALGIDIDSMGKGA